LHECDEMCDGLDIRVLLDAAAFAETDTRHVFRQRLAEMLLEEALAFAAFGTTNQRERAIEEARHDPVRDVLVETREFQFRETGFRIHHAFGMRDANAGHRGLVAAL